MLAFLFSKIGAYVVGGLLIAALVGGGYWYVKHLQGKVASLQTELANANLKIEVAEKARVAAEQFKQEKVKVVTRYVQQEKQIDSAVQSGDDAAMRELYIRAGMLQPSQDGTAPSR